MDGRLDKNQQAKLQALRVLTHLTLESCDRLLQGLLVLHRLHCLLLPVCRSAIRPREPPLSCFGSAALHSFQMQMPG